MADDIAITIRIPVKSKQRLQEVAKRRGTTLTGLLLAGGEMLAGFDEDFLAQIEKTAEIARTDIFTVIEQLLTVYMAQDYAIYDTLGVTKTFSRAFQIERDGIMRGDRLSKSVESEVREAVQALLEKLQTAENGIRITREEAALLCARM